jgi:NAD(P)-dependent dehydrogenase (short-subunit alcohol dehydrogenase family)
MTTLRTALEQYLSMRQGLGYKYQHQARRFADFVSLMEKRRANHRRPCDVADDAQVEAMVAQTVAAFGRLDAAYNNAVVRGDCRHRPR